MDLLKVLFKEKTRKKIENHYKLIKAKQSMQHSNFMRRYNFDYETVLNLSREYVPALLYLGELFETDFKRFPYAAYCYKKAADQGSRKAAEKYAKMCEKGWGIPRNLMHAELYCKMAKGKKVPDLTHDTGWVAQYYPTDHIKHIGFSEEDIISAWDAFKKIYLDNLNNYLVEFYKVLAKYYIFQLAVNSENKVSLRLANNDTLVFWNWRYYQYFNYCFHYFLKYRPEFIEHPLYQSFQQEIVEKTRDEIKQTPDKVLHTTKGSISEAQTQFSIRAKNDPFKDYECFYDDACKRAINVAGDIKNTTVEYPCFLQEKKIENRLAAIFCDSILAEKRLHFLSTRDFCFGDVDRGYDNSLLASDLKLLAKEIFFSLEKQLTPYFD